jgi:signal transduction histidine kinase
MTRFLGQRLSSSLNAWLITAIALLLTQVVLSMMFKDRPSAAGRAAMGYSPMLMTATAIAIVNAIARTARMTILFWAFFTIGIVLWLMDILLWTRFSVEFPDRFSLLVAMLSLLLVAYFLSVETTQRKRAEKALTESEERLRLAAQAGKMYAYEWDARKNRIVRSAECIDILGGVANLDNETFDRMLARIHIEDRERFANAVKALSRAHPICQLSYRIARSDGSIIWLEESAQALFDSHGAMMRLVAMVADVSRRKEAEKALSDLSGRFVAALEQDRTRVAKELHDDVSQRLALVAIMLKSLGQNLPKTNAEIVAALQSMWQTVSEISSEIHYLSRQLHPSTLGLGLGSALRTFCEGVERQYGLKVRVTCQRVPDAVPGDDAMCVYRVAQEAISNIVKHSQAKEARLELTGTSDHLELVISDEGKGFEYDTERELGLGLLSMRERLRLVGGTLRIRAGSGGTEVVAQVPLKPAVLRTGAPETKTTDHLSV